MTVRVAINGFGRIGRNILRAIHESGRSDLTVVALNDLGAVETNAHLLRYDSVHGRFPGRVAVGDGTIDIGAGPIRVLSERDPARLPWADLGIDVALECTGLFTAREKAAAHLEAGARAVLISAPGTDSDLTVVYGVNHGALTAEHRIVSNASCTTNCLAPVASVLHEAVGIESGFMTTVHAYTLDQPVLDTLHKDLRRARGAAGSMIPTSTGAARAVGLVLPALAGKLDGTAVRVPTANVSMVDLGFVAKPGDIGGRDQRGHRERRRRRHGRRAGLFRGAAGLGRFQPSPGKLHRRCRPDRRGRGHALPRALLVRQRVGFLEPDGRRRRPSRRPVTERATRPTAPFAA